MTDSPPNKLAAVVGICALAIWLLPAPGCTNPPIPRPPKFSLEDDWQPPALPVEPQTVVTTAPSTPPGPVRELYGQPLDGLLLNMFVLKSDPLFLPGRARMFEGERPELNAVVAQIAKEWAGTRLMILCHTDNDPLRHSPYRDQYEYSQYRAQSARAYLLARGFGPTTVVAMGLGGDFPIAPNTTREGKSANRRLEIAVIRPDKPMTSLYGRDLGGTVIQRFVFPADKLFGNQGTGIQDLESTELETISLGIRSDFPNALIRVFCHRDNAQLPLAPTQRELICRNFLPMHLAEQVRDAFLYEQFHERINAYSAGDKYPIASNDTPQGRKANRRVEIFVVLPLQPDQPHSAATSLYGSLTPGTIVHKYVLGRDELFLATSWGLTPEGKQRLDRITAEIASKFPKTEILVIGHRDKPPLLTADDLKTLTQQRADAVAKYLLAVKCGTAGMTVYGEDSAFPVASNETLEGKSHNRRIEIVLVQP